MRFVNDLDVYTKHGGGGSLMSDAMWVQLSSGVGWSLEPDASVLVGRSEFEHIAIDIDLHTGGGPIWPSHRLWRDNPEQRAYNEL